MSGAAYQVFADSLMELGFEPVAFRTEYTGLDMLFGEDGFYSRCVRCKRPLKKGYSCGPCIDETGQLHTAYETYDPYSVLEVKIYDKHVNVQWVTSWTRPAEGYPTYSYPFPKFLDEATLRVKQLIELARIKERGGGLLHVPMDFSIP